MVVLFGEINQMLRQLPGRIGFYYKDLNSGKIFDYNADQHFLAASIIKLPVLMAVMQEMKNGKIKRMDSVKVTKGDKVPSCGALAYMHDDMRVTVQDLYTLMIILSDNTAANILIRLVGMERINELLEQAGLKRTRLSRLLFDSEAQAEGKENTFSPAEAGMLLENIHLRTFVDEEMSIEAENILKLQQIKTKIRSGIPREVPIAHKTGEDSHMTHDVGIIYSKNPFIVCFASNESDVTLAEETIRKVALMLYRYSIA
jgi:beta-lactamase class A